MKELQLEELVKILHNLKEGDLIACVGTEIRSDDAVALKLCDVLKEVFSESKIIKCYGGLENCFAEIIERNPKRLIVIDALYSDDIQGGKIFVLSPEEAGAGFPWSHRMPLNVVLSVIKNEINLEEIEIIGISCEDLSLGDDLSLSLKNFLRRLKALLVSDYFQFYLRDSL